MKQLLLMIVVALGALAFAADVTPVDVNSATQAQIEALPGIGAKLAADIVSARPFKDVADFQAKVKGISAKNFKKMQPYLQFGAAAAANIATTSTTNTNTTKTNANKTNANKTVAPGTCAVTPVNLNKSSAQDLNTVPGIGDKIAAEIVQGRPYKDENDLVAKIKGIGPKNIVKFRACFQY